MSGIKLHNLVDGKMQESLHGEWCRVKEATPLLNLGAEFEALFKRLKALGDVRLEDLVKDYETKEEHLRLQLPRVEPSEHTRDFLRVPQNDQAKGFYVEAVTPDRLCLRVNGDVHFWIKYFNADTIMPRGFIHIDRRLRITNIMAPGDLPDAN